MLMMLPHGKPLSVDWQWLQAHVPGFGCERIVWSTPHVYRPQLGARTLWIRPSYPDREHMSKHSRQMHPNHARNTSQTSS